jgi:hypothetical protein
MLAALQGHGFTLPTGKERLLIDSIGTGRYSLARLRLSLETRRPRKASPYCNRSGTIASE